MNNCFQLLLIAATLFTLIACIAEPILDEPSGKAYKVDTIKKRVAAPDGSIPRDSSTNSEGKKVPIITVPFFVDDYFIPEGWLNPLFENYTFDKKNPQFNMSVQKNRCRSSRIYTDTDSSKTYTPDIYLCNSISYTSITDTNYAGMYWLSDANWGADKTRHERPVSFEISNLANKITFWFRGTSNRNTLTECTTNANLVAQGKCDWLDSIKISIGNEIKSKALLTTEYSVKSAWNNEIMLPLTNEWQKYEIRLNHSDETNSTDINLSLDSTIHITGYNTIDSLGQAMYNAFGWLTSTGPDQPLVQGYSIEFSLDSIMYSDKDMTNKSNQVNNITGKE